MSNGKSMTVYEFRTLMGLTQVELAKGCGLLQSHISRVENGRELKGRNWTRLIHYSKGAISLTDEYPEECVS